MKTEYCSCIYHSCKWAYLTVQGWVTMTVDTQHNGIPIARMMRQTAEH